MSGSRAPSSDGGGRMHDEAVVEMVVDWMAARRAYEGTWPWGGGHWRWLEHSWDRLQLHPGNKVLAGAISCALGYAIAIPLHDWAPPSPTRASPHRSPRFARDRLSVRVKQPKPRTIVALWKILDAARDSSTPHPVTETAIAKLRRTVPDVHPTILASLAVHDGGVHLQSYDLLSAKQIVDRNGPHLLYGGNDTELECPGGVTAHFWTGATLIGGLDLARRAARHRSRALPADSAARSR